MEHDYFSDVSVCRNDAIKQSVKCSKCSSPRPVDIRHWRLMYDECGECETQDDEHDLVERYREMRTLVATISTDQALEENTFNYLHSWCAAMMGEVCSEKDVMYVMVCHFVHTICMQHQLWTPAILYGEIVLPAFIFYFGKKSKIVAALLIR